MRALPAIVLLSAVALAFPKGPAPGQSKSPEPQAFRNGRSTPTVEVLTPGAVQSLVRSTYQEESAIRDRANAKREGSDQQMVAVTHVLGWLALLQLLVVVAQAWAMFLALKSERAWVGLGSPKGQLINDGKMLLVQFGITNHGKTPAFMNTWTTHLEYGAAVPSGSALLANRSQLPATIAPGEVMPALAWAAYTPEAGPLYAISLVEYRTIFSVFKIKRDCRGIWQWNAEHSQFVMVSSEAYGKNT